MRQVPQYLIIGSGRMARHFKHYLSLLDIPFSSWSRRDHSDRELFSLVQQCSFILLLISDSAIPQFVQQYSFFQEKTVVHFSGQLSLAKIYSAHPLSTFTQVLYDLNTYKKISFILEERSPDLSHILPGLENPYFKIPSQMKPYYHALCVMAGNFTSLLWQKFFREIESQFHLPKEIAFAYLEQISKNLRENPQAALTGPLVRGDKKTIEANLAALQHDDFKEIYQAFVNVFQKNCIGDVL